MQDQAAASAGQGQGAGAGAAAGQGEAALVGALVVVGGAAAQRALLPLEVLTAAAADGELGDAAAMGLEFDPAASAKRNLQGYMGFRRLQMASTDADEAMQTEFDAAATAKRNLQGYMGF